MRRGVGFKLIAALLIYANLLPPALLLAETAKPAGVVSALKGEVLITRASLPQQPASLKFKDDVFFKDRITTKEQSLVRVLMGGKALITVRELSELTITEEPGKPSLIDLAKGKIGLAVARARMSPGESIEVRTPNAVAAVRGTVIVVEVLPAVAAPGATGAEPDYQPVRTSFTGQATPVQAPSFTTTFHVIKGSIEVVSIGQPGAQPVSVGAGLSVRITGATIGQPQPSPPMQQITGDLQTGPQHTGTPQETTETITINSLNTATTLGEIITGGTSQPTTQTPNTNVIIPKVETVNEFKEPTPLISLANTFVNLGASPLATMTGGGTGNDITINLSAVPMLSTTGPSPNITGPLGGPTFSLTDSTIVGDPGIPLFTVTGTDVTAVGTLLTASGKKTGQTFTIDAGSFLTLASSATIGGGLELTGGASAQFSDDVVSVPAGSTVTATGPLFSLSESSTLTTSGKLAAVSGTMVLGGALLDANSSAVSSSGAVLNVTGASSTVTGPIGASLFSIAAGSSVTAGGALVHLGTGASLNLHGDLLTLSAPGPISVSGALVDIESGATLNLQADVSITGPSANTVTNAGTLSKSAGTGTATIGVGLTNSGAVSVQSGTLALTGGGTDTGSFTVSSGGILQFGGGTHNLNAGSSLNGAGTVQVSGGTVNLNASGVDRLTGTLNVSSGTLSVTGDLVVVTSGTPLNPTGTMVNVSGGNTTVTGHLINATGNNALVTSSIADLVSLSGSGTRNIATGGSAAMFTLTGATTMAETDPDASSLIVGTDTPLQHGGVLLAISGATVTGQQAVKLDTALLSASTSLLNLTAGSVLTSAGDLVNLAQNAKLTTAAGFLATDALVKLSASTLTVTNGSLFTVAGGSFLNVPTGSLFSLDNGSTLNITSGPLVLVSGGSVFELTAGSLGSFGATGTNTLSFTSAPACGGPSCIQINTSGYFVLLQNGAVGGNLLIDPLFVPFTDLGGGITVSGLEGKALLVLDGALSTILLGVAPVPPVSPGNPPLVTIGASTFTLSARLGLVSDGFPATAPAPQAYTGLSGTQGTLYLAQDGEGAGVTLSGGIGITGSTINAAFNDVFRVGGVAEIGGSVLSLSNSSITDALDILFIGSLSSLTTTSSAPLVSLSNTSLGSTGNPVHGSVLQVQLGGQADLAGPLLVATAGSSIALEANALRVAGGGALIGRAPSALIQLDSSTIEAGVSTGCGECDTVLIADGGTVQLIGGTLLSATNSTLTEGGPAFISFSNGSQLTVTLTSEPLVKLTGGTLNLNNASFFLVSGSSTVTLSGPLLQATGTTISASTSNSFVVVSGSSSLTVGGPVLDLDLTGTPRVSLGSSQTLIELSNSTLTTTAGPAVKITGGSLIAQAAAFLGGSSTLNATGNFLELAGSTTVTLDHVVRMGTNNLSVTGNLAQVGAGSSLVLSDTLLVSFGSPNVTISGNILNLAPGAAQVLTRPILETFGGTVSVGGGVNVPAGASLTQLTANSVLTGVGVGSNPESVAITPDGARAYVTNFSSATVSVIDTATNTVIDTVPLGANLRGVAITPDGARVYVAAPPATVSVIDTATNNVTTVPLEAGVQVRGVAITPDGTRAYVTYGNISVIDTAPASPTFNTVTATIPVGSVASALAITPDGARAYVAQLGGNTVSVIDTAPASPTFNTVTATVSVGLHPNAVAITPDGGRAYVANGDNGTVSVISTATNTVIATVPVVTPSGVAITPDGAWVYVASGSSNTVSVISTATNTVAATVVGVGLFPSGVAITPDGARVYVTNQSSSTVSVIGDGNLPLFQTQGGTLTVSGSLLTSSGGAVNVPGDVVHVVNVSAAGGFVTSPTASFVSLTGGTHMISTGATAAMFNLRGSTTALFDTGVDDGEGFPIVLSLGTDRPLRGPGICPDCSIPVALFEATNATVTTNQAVKLDRALLEATAPLIRLMAASTMTSTSDFINLASQANLTGNLLSTDALVMLNASTLNVTGSLFNVVGGSYLNVTGDLVQLAGGSTLVINGALLTVSGGSVVSTSGALLAFSGTGNTVQINNTLCAPCISVGAHSIPVALTNSAVSGNVTIGPTAYRNLAGNTVTLSNPTLSTGGTAVIVVNGLTSKVRIGGL